MSHLWVRAMASPAHKHTGYGERQGGCTWRGRRIGNRGLWDLRKECFLVLRAGDWCSASPSQVPVSLWQSDLEIWFWEELSLMEAVNDETIWKSASLLPAGLISPRLAKSLKILLWQVTKRKQSTLIIAAISAHPRKPEQTTTVKAPRQQGPVEMRNLISYENFISWRCGSKNLEVQSRWAAWILGGIVLLLVIWLRHREDLENLWGHKYRRLSWNIPGWRVVWCRRHLLGAQQTFLHNISKVMEARSCWAPVFCCVREGTIWAEFAALWAWYYLNVNLKAL